MLDAFVFVAIARSKDSPRGGSPSIESPSPRTDDGGGRCADYVICMEEIVPQDSHYSSPVATHSYDVSARHGQDATGLCTASYRKALNCEQRTELRQNPF